MGPNPALLSLCFLWGIHPTWWDKSSPFELVLSWQPWLKLGLMWIPPHIPGARLTSPEMPSGRDVCLQTKTIANPQGCLTTPTLHRRGVTQRGGCEIQACPVGFSALSVASAAPAVVSDGKIWLESTGMGTVLCTAQSFGGREMLPPSLCLCPGLEGGSPGVWVRFADGQHKLRMPAEILPFASFLQLPSKHFLGVQEKGCGTKQNK